MGTLIPSETITDHHCHCHGHANILKKSDVQGSVHRKCITKYDQKDAMLHSFLFLQTALHVLGGSPIYCQEHNTVSTASGIRQTVTATYRYRGRVETAVSTLPR